MNINRLEPILDIFCPLKYPTGGALSLFGLAIRLHERIPVRLWSLDDDVAASLREQCAHYDVPVSTCFPIQELPEPSNLLFYMNQYPVRFANHVHEWEPLFCNANSLQISINYTFGGLPKHDFYSDALRCVYFQNIEMRDFWLRKVQDTRLATCPTKVLPPPVDIEDLFLIPEKEPDDSIVVGRLTGDAPAPDEAVALYQRLADELPNAEFWFMPTPKNIAQSFSGHPRFRLLKEQEIPVKEFIGHMDIFCVPVKLHCPTMQGTRTLSEVMAAARPSVNIDRYGPRDRVVHGESGFLAGKTEEMADYVVQLARDPALRRKMGAEARERARSWRLDDWTDAIIENMRPREDG